MNLDRSICLPSAYLCVAVLLLSACGMVRTESGGTASDPAQQKRQAEQGATTLLDELKPADLPAGDRLRVVVTTSMMGDVVGNVAGAEAEVSILLSRGADPHSYELTSQDLQSLEAAHLIFVNGFGLEEGLLETIQLAAGAVPILSLSEGLEPLAFAEETGENFVDEAQVTERQGVANPHVWFDPTYVLAWSGTAAEALSRRDPDVAELYQANASNYQAELAALDAWILEQVAGLDAEQRRLVTDHDALGYFADRYGFEIVGAVVPGTSTAAVPSAGELAALIESIEAQNARAIFVDTAIDPTLAERIAQEAGVVVVPIFVGSLSEADGPAGDYLSFMRYNVASIVGALQ